MTLCALEGHRRKETVFVRLFQMKVRNAIPSLRFPQKVKYVISAPLAHENAKKVIFTQDFKTFIC